MHPYKATSEHHQKTCNPFDAVSAGAFAARPVKRNEYMNIKEALDAYWKECKNLQSREVCRWEDCVEWNEVGSAAIAAREEAHLGFLFGIMVEKGSEFPEGDPRRYWKHRVIFRGNDGKDQNWGAAMFQQMATTPTMMKPSRYSDLLACVPGNSVEGRNVQQAYLQVDRKALPRTWFSLTDFECLR